MDSAQADIRAAREHLDAQGWITRRSEAFHHAVTELMPQLLWTMGPDGKIDFINRRMREFTGIDDPEVIGERFRHIHPDDLAAHHQRLLAGRAAGQPVEAEMRIRRRDGTYLWHLVRAEPLRGSRTYTRA